MKIYIVVTDVVNDITYYMCGHTIFMTMLSTGKQWRHMIIQIIHVSDCIEIWENKTRHTMRKPTFGVLR